MKTNDYVVGLDIGITSVGFGIIDVENNKLVEMGTRHFEEAKQASERRSKRSARRNIRRKKWRKKQLVNAFVDFGIIDEEIIKQNNYLSFTYNSNNITRPIDDTVYHLRKRALNEKVSERELLLALYHICKTRGHFLMESVDFEKSDSIDFNAFKELFYNWTSVLFDYYDDKSEFEKEVLKPIFDKKLFRSNDIKTKVKNINIIDDENNDRLLELLKLITGFDSKLEKVTDVEEITGGKKSTTVSKLKGGDPSEVTDFLAIGVELYDLIQINSVISNHDYLCEVAVENLDKFKELFLKKDINENEYNNFITEIKNKMNISGKETKKDKDGKKNETIRVVKNLDNSYPNGLYIKEAKHILRKQKEYNDKITDEFIEVVGEIISARIPFYIGPLSKDGTNAWIDDKKHGFKYSYNYTQKYFNAIDEARAIKNWKEKMISRCTYLPDEYALPKGSFIYEIYSILNELNILQAIDHNGEEYLLTKEDKCKVINQLFLNGKDSKVKFKTVSELLDLDSFGDSAGKMKAFNNGVTIYKNIISLIPRLKLNDINELFTCEDKVNEIEEIILNISLFDEEIAKANYFKQYYDEDVAMKLAKLNVKGFYSLSRKFLMAEGMDIDGNSMMELLFEDNKPDIKNEQMTIISNSVNKDGSTKDLIANKYMRLMKDNKELSIDLLIDEGKPLIPMSRPVIRGLNETFKVYQDIIKLYGVPKRVVIETAKDFYNEGKTTKKHKDALKDTYNELIRQLKNNENLRNYNQLDSWKDVENYLNKNKDKIELYVKQLGCDMIDGKAIDLNSLTNYEIDHILPRGFGDDSMDNKMLISKHHNAKKKNRVPLEYIGSENVGISSKQFKDRVDSLYKLGSISSKKKERLLLQNTEVAIGFVNRDLVDTRYIISEFTSILKAFNIVNEYQTQVVSLKATYTNIARKVFGFKKDRDFGLQHHAHDASLIAVADICLRGYFPGYDKRNNLSSYKNFIESITNKNGDENNQNDIRYIMYGAYHKAFGQSCKLGSSVINQIKEVVPLFSEKVMKNSGGQLFNENLDPSKNYEKKKPLSVLGINKEKCGVYKGTKCVAVDFYRYKKIVGKKQKTIHVAIQIPDAIVDNGIINKNKYIKLIKEFYKCDDLIDENGEIKNYYFRFRAFNHDIIYDTQNNIPIVFVCGTIAKRALEFKYIKMFSYNDIYNNAFNLYSECVNHFKLENKNGKLCYGSYTIEDFEEHLYGYIGFDNKKLIKEKIKGITKLFNLCEVLGYLMVYEANESIPVEYRNRYRPVVNNELIKINGEAEYIKIKSTSLGVRWRKENGRLKISGPNGKQNAYKRIRKDEKFSWNLSKYDV